TRRLLAEARRPAIRLRPDVDRAAPDPGARPGSGGGRPEREGRASAVRDVVEVRARALTDRPGDVRVTETRHRGTKLVELYVAPGELGRIIGRQGRTAAALRTLASSAGEREGKTVTLEIREGKP